MKQYFIIIFLLCNFYSLRGQERSLINHDLLKNKWDAQWITCPDVSLTDFGIFHFRKTFQLSERPDRFIINVSGDNRYRLFVNGNEVCNGGYFGQTVPHISVETVPL